MMINKSWGAKLLSDLVIFSVCSSCIRFPQLNPSSATKLFSVFIAGIITKKNWNISVEKFLLH